MSELDGGKQASENRSFVPPPPTQRLEEHRALFFKGSDDDRDPIRRVLKKLLRKVTWPLFRRQVAFNQAVYESLGSLYALSQAKSVYLGNNRALARTLWGHKIILDTKDISIAPHILLDGYWEMWITAVFLRTLREGMTVVEVGANVGYYTLIAASGVGVNGKVHAFEANPEVFGLLFQNVEINGFLDRVTLINKAVSNKSGQVTFHKLERHHGNSSLFEFSKDLCKRFMDTCETLEIESLSLDDYFLDKDVSVDMIKIDAEGSEPLILRGAKHLIRNNPQVVIICEFNPCQIANSGESPRAFLEEVAGHGFKFQLIDHDSDLQEVSLDRLLTLGQCELFLTR